MKLKKITTNLTTIETLEKIADADDNLMKEKNNNNLKVLKKSKKVIGKNINNILLYADSLNLEFAKARSIAGNKCEMNFEFTFENLKVMLAANCLFVIFMMYIFNMPPIVSSGVIIVSIYIYFVMKRKTVNTFVSFINNVDNIPEEQLR